MRHGPLLLLCFWLPSLHAQPPARASAELEGDVVDATTGAPLPGARLKLDRQENEPRYLKADAHGHFQLSNLEPGLYLLSAAIPGFLPLTSYAVDLTAPRAGGQRGAIVVRSSDRSEAAAPRPTIANSIGPGGAAHAKVSVPLVPYAVIAFGRRQG